MCGGGGGGGGQKRIMYVLLYVANLRTILVLLFAKTIVGLH